MATQRTTSELLATIQAILGGGTPLVTKAALKPLIDDLAVSLANKDTDFSLLGLNQHDPLRAYKSGEGVLKEGNLWYAMNDITANTPWDIGNFIQITGSSSASSFNIANWDPAHNGGNGYNTDDQVLRNDQIFTSNVDSNTIDPSINTGNVWRIISANDGLFGNDWSEGLYLQNQVITDPISKDLYYLDVDTSVNPYSSTDLQTEIDNGYWKLFHSLGGIRQDVNRIDSTGIISGSVISVNAMDNSLYDLAAGSALLIDNSDLLNRTIYEISWTAQTGLSITNLASQPRTNIGITNDNTPLSGVSFTEAFQGTINGVLGTLYIAEKAGHFSPSEYRSLAEIGRLIHVDNLSISSALNLQKAVYGFKSCFYDLSNIVEPLNFEGNDFSGVAGTLKIQKTFGRGFRMGVNYGVDTKNPNVQDLPASNPTPFSYRWRNGIGGFTLSSVISDILTDKWDDGAGAIDLASLPSVPANSWTIQPVFIFAGSGNVFIGVGQQIFVSRAAAVSALPNISPAIDPNLSDDAIFRGWFLVRSGGADTDLLTDFDWRRPLGEFSDTSKDGVPVNTQSVYEASVSPQIVTNATNGALTVKGGTGNEADTILRVLNNAGQIMLSVTGQGVVLPWTGVNVNIGVGATQGGVISTANASAGIHLDFDEASDDIFWFNRSLTDFVPYDGSDIRFRLWFSISAAPNPADNVIINLTTFLLSAGDDHTGLASGSINTIVVDTLAPNTIYTVDLDVITGALKDFIACTFERNSTGAGADSYAGIFRLWKMRIIKA